MSDEFDDSGVLNERETIERAMRAMVDGLNAYVRLMSMPWQERTFDLEAWTVDDAVVQLALTTYSIRRQNEAEEVLAYCRDVLELICDRLKKDFPQIADVVTSFPGEFLRHHHASSEGVVVRVWQLWDFYRGMILGHYLDRLILGDIIAKGLDAGIVQSRGGKVKASNARPRQQRVLELARSLWPRKSGTKTNKAAQVARRLATEITAENESLRKEMSPLFPLKTVGARQILNWFNNGWKL